MGTALTLADLNTTVNHEPRIQDERLGQALGFANPRMIRKLIMRHNEALQRFGEVCSTVEQTSSKGGRPAKVVWLNKKQSLYLCTKSETANATEVTIQMVEVFDDYLKGEMKPVKVRSPRRSSLTARLAAIEQRLQEIAPAQSFPDLPEGIGAIILNGEPVYFDIRARFSDGDRAVVVTAAGDVKVDACRKVTAASEQHMGPRTAKTSPQVEAVPGRGDRLVEWGCMILGKVVERRALAHHASREIAAH